MITHISLYGQIAHHKVSDNSFMIVAVSFSSRNRRSYHSQSNLYTSKQIILSTAHQLCLTSQFVAYSTSQPSLANEWANHFISYFISLQTPILNLSLILSGMVSSSPFLPGLQYARPEGSETCTHTSNWSRQGHECRNTHQQQQ